MLPRLAAVYTEPELKLVRQLSIEVHSAASRDREVRRVLALSDEAAMRYIGDAISIAQRDGTLDPKINPDFAARLFCVFVMGLLHMDTLLPNLIGDKSWRDFVHERISTLIGAAEPKLPFDPGLTMSLRSLGYAACEIFYRRCCSKRRCR